MEIASCGIVALAPRGTPVSSLSCGKRGSQSLPVALPPAESGGNILAGIDRAFCGRKMTVGLQQSNKLRRYPVFGPPAEARAAFAGFVTARRNQEDSVLATYFRARQSNSK
jgi:hypothetical protein